MEREPTMATPEAAVRARPGLRVIEGGLSAGARRNDLLARLVPAVRIALDIDHRFPDDAILHSLREIAAATTAQTRWLAAFQSDLGLVLSMRIGDLWQRLETVIGMVARAGDQIRRADWETCHDRR
jgi:hypothetical protein